MPRLSCGVVVVRAAPAAPAGWELLVLRAYRSWDFPKGKVEPGELPLEAARRETREETGITRLDFRWGEEFAETERYAGGKVARYYIAQTDEGITRLPISPELGRPEHHEFRWVTIPQARRLLPPRLTPVLAWAEGKLVIQAESGAPEGG